MSAIAVTLTKIERLARGRTKDVVPRTLPRAPGLVATLALSLTAVAVGCGSHESSSKTVQGVIPSTSALVFLATALPCKKVTTGEARFTPLVVRGPSYVITVEPDDNCRRQRSGAWYSYGYSVPVPRSGEVRLTPGNQPAATLSGSKLQINHAATIYYVNCSDYYSGCPEGDQFHGRISSLEYFKDEDVSDAPN